MKAKHLLFVVIFLHSLVSANAFPSIHILRPVQSNTESHEINRDHLSISIDTSLYFTKIKLDNKAKLEGYIIKANSKVLILACCSCVDPGLPCPEIEIPPDRIKSIVQKASSGKVQKYETSDYDYGYENYEYDTGCLDIGVPDLYDITVDGWDAEGCTQNACLIATGVSAIAIIIILIVNEYNYWERYKINGDVAEYIQILPQLNSLPNKKGR